MPTFAELAAEKVPGNLDGISMVPALMGKDQKEKHQFLYWDYGHCRSRYDQAVRMGKWKGIRHGKESQIALYNIEQDIGEVNNMADKFPDIVQKIEEIMETAVIPSERYTVGDIYEGGPIWKKQYPVNIKD